MPPKPNIEKEVQKRLKQIAANEQRRKNREWERKQQRRWETMPEELKQQILNKQVLWG